MRSMLYFLLYKRNGKFAHFIGYGTVLMHNTSYKLQAACGQILAGGTYGKGLSTSFEVVSAGLQDATKKPRKTTNLRRRHHATAS